MIKIRFAQPSELNHIKRVYKKAYIQFSKDEIMSYFLGRLNKDKIKNKEILVACDESKIIGLCSFSCTPVFANSIYIEDVVILKDYRRKGVGLSLIKKVLEIAKSKGLRRAFTNTWLEHTASIQLNKKLGFKYCGKLAKVTSEKEDHIFFSRKL